MRRPRGYWQDENNLVAEARKAMQEQGWDTLPGVNTLREQGYNSLVSSVKLHGGMNALRELLNQDISRRPKGYWQDQTNMLAEAKKAMEEHGWKSLPSSHTFHKYGYSSLAHAVRYHGGMPGLRKLLGEGSFRQPYGFWQDPLNIVVEARKAMQENGWDTLPGATTLHKKGYSKICSAAKFHGGMDGIRKLLGQESLTRPRGYWMELPNVLAETRRAMEKQGWDSLPSQKTLQKHGYSALAAAAKHHGGMSGLRDLISKSLQQPTEQEQLEVLVGGYDA